MDAAAAPAAAAAAAGGAEEGAGRGGGAGAMLRPLRRTTRSRPPAPPAWRLGRGMGEWDRQAGRSVGVSVRGRWVGWWGWSTG